MFPDITSLSESQANAIVLDELRQAGIPAVRAYPDSQNSVRASYIGVLLFAGHIFVFTRRTSRWVARCIDSSWNKKLISQSQKIQHRIISNKATASSLHEWRIFAPDALSDLVGKTRAIWGQPIPSLTRAGIDITRISNRKLTANPRFVDPPQNDVQKNTTFEARVQFAG